MSFCKKIFASSWSHGVTGISVSRNDENQIVTIQGTLGLFSLSDITSGEVMYQRQMNDPVHGVSFLNESLNVLLVCCGNNGDLLTCDLREPHCAPANNPGLTLSATASPIVFSASKTSALTFSDSVMKLYDSRSLTLPFAVVSMKDDQQAESPCVKVLYYYFYVFDEISYSTHYAHL